MVSYNKRNNRPYDKKYREKIQIKRRLSKTFDREFKAKQNARQQKYRERKKQADAEAAIALATPLTKSNSRKAEGTKRRRAYTRKLKIENENLMNKVKKLEKENLKMKKLVSQQHSEETNTVNATPIISPAKLFIDNVSPTAKKRATKRLLDQKENLPHGFVSKIRKELGVNLSNSYNPPSNTSSQLQKDIEEFLCQDDVTKQAPDKKKQIHGKQIRYLLNHLSIIHQRFINETGNNCHYSTFTRYVPAYVLKPIASDWGTCLCAVCLNPQMKLEKLQNLKSRHSVLKNVLIDGLTDITELVTDEIKTKAFQNNLSTLKQEQFNITYSEWIKKKNERSNVPVSTKTMITSTIADFVDKFMNEIESLTQHIDRVRQQFRAAKEARQMATEQDDTVTIHLDWSENFNLKQTRQEKGK